MRGVHTPALPHKAGLGCIRWVGVDCDWHPDDDDIRYGWHYQARLRLLRLLVGLRVLPPYFPGAVSGHWSVVSLLFAHNILPNGLPVVIE